jgi:pyruvate dehydrogenase E1 component
MRARGFLLGGTAGRTTLNGEGLQHQDGHSPLIAMAFPHVRVFDPAFSYETTTIVLDGLKRMYGHGEDVIYYITLYNENYRQLGMPENAQRGILEGMYRLHSNDVGHDRPRVQLFGSGPIVRESLRAQEILAEKYQISSDVWSVTSYKQLRTNAAAASRWNWLHPEEEPRRSYLQEVLSGVQGPFIASSDYVRQVPEAIAPWVPGQMVVLGTDGFGLSETRSNLRRHFEVDAECITVAALYALANEGQVERAQVTRAIKDLGIDPEQIDPAALHFLGCAAPRG